MITTQVVEQGPRQPKQRRRGRGEGSIFQRPDGRWVATISLGIGADGKRKRRTIYGATKRHVQDELTKLQSSKMTGTLSAPSKLTVAQFLERWLADVASTTVRPSTFANYEGVSKNHILSRIGGVPLQKLTPMHVQHLYAEMERAGAGPHGRKLAHCVLHRALKDAVRAGLAVRKLWTLSRRASC
jgi:integrase